MSKVIPSFCSMPGMRVGGDGLYSIEEQSQRIHSAQRAADRASVPAFINARTDLFLRTAAERHDERLVDDAMLRAQAYADAGANGLFLPGLPDERLIGRACDASPFRSTSWCCRRRRRPGAWPNWAWRASAMAPVPTCRWCARWKRRRSAFTLFGTRLDNPHRPECARHLSRLGMNKITRRAAPADSPHTTPPAAASARPRTWNRTPGAC